MSSKANKKITTVREHIMKVLVSEKNPTGTTIRDSHVRRLKGTYLDLLSPMAASKKRNSQK